MEHRFSPQSGDTEAGPQILFSIRCTIRIEDKFFPQGTVRMEHKFPPHLRGPRGWNLSEPILSQGPSGWI